MTEKIEMYFVSCRIDKKHKAALKLGLDKSQYSSRKKEMIQSHTLPKKVHPPESTADANMKCNEVEQSWSREPKSHEEQFSKESLSRRRIWPNKTLFHFWVRKAPWCFPNRRSGSTGSDTAPYLLPVSLLSRIFSLCIPILPHFHWRADYFASCFISVLHNYTLLFPLEKTEISKMKLDTAKPSAACPRVELEWYVLWTGKMWDGSYVAIKASSGKDCSILIRALFY